MKHKFGFFDGSNRLRRLSGMGDPLEEISQGIDFEMFRPFPEGILERFDIENVESLCKDLPCKSLPRKYRKAHLFRRQAILSSAKCSKKGYIITCKGRSQ
jgi:hypothetical protein